MGIVAIWAYTKAISCEKIRKSCWTWRTECSAWIGQVISKLVCGTIQITFSLCCCDNFVVLLWRGRTMQDTLESRRVFIIWIWTYTRTNVRILQSKFRWAIVHTILCIRKGIIIAFLDTEPWMVVFQQPIRTRGHTHSPSLPLKLVSLIITLLNAFVGVILTIK